MSEKKSFRIPVVSVVGKGGSGRTTLLESLIAELSRRGFLVATAKHHFHKTDIDVPGKDTWRHSRAGARMTMVSAPDRIGIFKKTDREHSLEDLAEIAGDADILLTEGFSRTSPVLVEIVRSERSVKPICRLEDLFALVTDVQEMKGRQKTEKNLSHLPVFRPDDSEGLADLIQNTFLKEKKTRPAENKKVEESRIIYMDHATTSWPKPGKVASALFDTMQTLGANPGRGAHSMAIAADRRITDARRTCAELFNIRDYNNLIFLPGCTAACNLMLNGVLKPGDRVVVSSMEHNAVARPLARLASLGVEIVMVRADSTGFADPGDMEKEVRAGKTRALICQHASNVSGTIQPVEELSEVAHENGALFLVDGAQAAGHIEVDISSFSPDAYAVSGHKGLCGPQGTGLLYLSPDLEPEPPAWGGSAGGDSSSLEMPGEKPHRYEAGTLNTPGIAGLAQACRLHLEEGITIRKRVHDLCRRLYEGILKMEGFKVKGPAFDVLRIPLISMVHENIEADLLAFILDRDYRIATRAGLHCSPWAHESLGTMGTGTLRLCPGQTNTDKDVDYVLSSLDEAVNRILKGSIVS